MRDARVEVLHAPDIRVKSAALAADPVGSTPGEFAAFVRRDMEKYATVVKVSGARID